MQISIRCCRQGMYQYFLTVSGLDRLPLIQLFTKITAAFKRPVKKPKLLIEAMVQWEKTGDLWSIVTDWLQSGLEKARDQNPTRRKRIRFSDPSSSALGFEDILRKSSFI